MFRRNAGAGVSDVDLHAVAVGRADVQRAALARHGVFGVQEQVQEHLLQLAGIAMDQRQVRRIESVCTFTREVLSWCSSSVSVSVMILFRSMALNSVPLVREKFSRLLTISEARKVWRVIFSSSGRAWRRH